MAIQFFGSDSGYDQHVARIAAQLKEFDLVALDMGQYDERWHCIHITPEEAALYCLVGDGANPITFTSH